MPNKDYQALARKHRPQRFSDVLGQAPIVKTLLNALKQERLAHAYLFSGARGTGKTTLARLLSKALNCDARDEACEPCNQCSSCREITQGNSLDVLEIDGASHRGIDDIRQLNETVGYAAPQGHYKVYIIDEVHMLTKEAFNALLKTLEEPPPKVKFFFATTEPHKVPSTILSRCQHFQLGRLTSDLITGKLRTEASDLGIEIDDAALHLISHAAEGGMRDAESILDQVISFHGDKIDERAVADVLGLAPRETFFRLDQAAAAGDLAAPFDIAEEVFSGGRDLAHFVEGLIEHYRTLLLLNLGAESHAWIPQSDHARYRESSQLFSREQLVGLIDYLVEVQDKIRFAPSPRVYLEMALSRVVRARTRLPLEVLVKRLVELEGKQPPAPQEPPAPPPPRQPVATPEPPPQPAKPKPSKPKPKPLATKAKGRYDTLLRFAAVELDGRVENVKRR